MQALLSRAPGGPETLVLEDVPAPTPAAGEVLIAVKACGVNFFDSLIIEDLYQVRPPRPFAPGSEFAGVVTAVGADVTRFAPGDRVVASVYWGGMAGARAVKETELVKMPDALSFDTAAALIVTYGTSHHALRDRAQLKPGQTLLVLGAAGGVGLAAVELGKAMGARVVAACSSQEKVDLCKAHGADDGVVYPRGPFDRDGKRDLAQLFKQAAGPNGFDVVYDAIGGDYAEPALRAVAWGGKYVVVGFAAGGIPQIPLNLPLLKGCDIVGVFWGDWANRFPAAFQAASGELMDMCLAGRISPVISERFPLAQGADAIRKLASRAAVGKLVVMVD